MQQWLGLHFQTWRYPLQGTPLYPLCPLRNRKRKCAQPFQHQHLLEICEHEPKWLSPTTARKEVLPLACWRKPLILWTQNSISLSNLNRSQRAKSRRSLNLPLRSIVWHPQRSQKMPLGLRCVSTSEISNLWTNTVSTESTGGPYSCFVGPFKRKCCSYQPAWTASRKLWVSFLNVNRKWPLPTIQ